jgi:hypothetical protein
MLGIEIVRGSRDDIEKAVHGKVRGHGERLYGLIKVPL